MGANAINASGNGCFLDVCLCLCCINVAVAYLRWGMDENVGESRTKVMVIWPDATWHFGNAVLNHSFGLIYWADGRIGWSCRDGIHALLLIGIGCVDLIYIYQIDYAACGRVS